MEARLWAFTVRVFEYLKYYFLNFLPQIVYHMHALVGVVCGAIEIDLLNGCDLSLLIFICQVDEANNYYVDNGFETRKIKNLSLF